MMESLPTRLVASTVPDTQPVPTKLVGSNVMQVEVIAALASQSVPAGAIVWFARVNAGKYVAISLSSWWDVATSAWAQGGLFDTTKGDSGTDLLSLSGTVMTTGASASIARTARKVGVYVASNVKNNDTVAHTLTSAELYGWRL